MYEDDCENCGGVMSARYDNEGNRRLYCCGDGSKPEDGCGLFSKILRENNVHHLRILHNALGNEG